MSLLDIIFSNLIHPKNKMKIMKKISFTKKGMLAFLTAVLFMVTSCNKNVPEAVPNTIPQDPGSTIGQILSTNTNFSTLNAIVTRAGLAGAVSSNNNAFTVFAPTNAAFTAIGIPSAAVVNLLPAANFASIVAALQYHIIPGQKLYSNTIPTTFPNVQMPTSFIFPAPNTNPLVRFSNFPSKRGSSVWVNNIPVATADVPASNGAIHVINSVMLPPTRLLLDTIARDPELTFLVAAVSRADAGLPAGSKLSDFLINPLANFTVFAPTNQAFTNFFRAQGVPAAAISPALFSTLPIQTVQAIVTYHLLGAQARTFSVNLPASPTPVPSLLSASLPTAPTLTVDAAQGVKGARNPTYSRITGADRHAINGVFHKIDQVLVPL